MRGYARVLLAISVLAIGAGTLLLPREAEIPSAQTGPPGTDAAPAQKLPLRTAVRVRVAAVREGHVGRSTSVSAVVNAFHKATTAAEVEGRVLERRIELGDRVKAQQVLILLDATRLELREDEARANVRAREIDLTDARRGLERGDQLVGKDAISESRHDDLRFGVERAETALSLARVALRTTRRSLADATVRAPFTGSVEAVHVDVGDYVSPGTPVAMLVDLSRARLRAGVTAAEAATLRTGETARAVFEDLGGLSLDGVIRSVGRVAHPQSGTYAVELLVENTDGQLREGMVAQVLLPQPAEGLERVVPRSALIRRDSQIAVFVVDRSQGEARAVARRVRVGRSNADLVEILEGVSLGDEVVIDGLFALSDGAPVLVESIPSGAAPPSRSAASGPRSGS